MSRADKIALARIISDLIKADSVIDNKEMKMFDEIKKEWNLDSGIILDSQKIAFSEAVNTLRGLGRDRREALIKRFKDITLADGLCNKDEALLIISIRYCIERGIATMVTVKEPGVQLDKAQAMYIESVEDEDVNKVISDNFTAIENAMRLAGFDFLYIPQMVKTYKQTEELLFNQVIHFLAPDMDDNEFRKVKKRLYKMNTVTFCKNELCRKLNIAEDTFVDPCILMKIGTSVANGNVYADYLNITLSNDVIEDIKRFIFDFSSILNSEYTYIKTAKNSHNKFIYSGIYKQVIDLCLMKGPKTSSILIDGRHETINFPELSTTTNPVNLKVSVGARALYILFLMESMRGGIRFPMVSDNDTKILQKTYREEIALYKEKYRRIYHMLAGDTGRIPDIEKNTIRRPMITHINKALGDSENLNLGNSEAYKVRKDEKGYYHVNIDSETVVFCTQGDKTVNWMEDEFWSSVYKLKISDIKVH